ncbi:MAG TPA: hypothetical protein VH062_06640 [Polyangiaceae bacterium]|jgi:hypothetical protein|nr:hypothetical protein [Polyangiaceae bacterium]
MNVRRIAAWLRLLARALMGAAEALEPPTPRKPGLVVEMVPAGTEEPAEYVAVGSEMAKADELCARIYLARALRRYSPTRPPSA